MSDAEESCLHDVITPWWVASTTPALKRGALVWTMVPYIEVVPYLLVATARRDPKDHSTASFRMAQLNVKVPVEPPHPPVAGLPLLPGEQYLVARSKMRPAIVIAGPGDALPEAVTKGMAGYQSGRGFVFAPAFGVDKSGKRGGFPDEFVRRVRRCMYSQFWLDRLPESTTLESLIRVDRLFCMIDHHQVFKATKWQLSPNALSFLDQWLIWHFTGRLQNNSELFDARELLLDQ